MSNQSEHSKAAAAIRKELKSVFPKVKFTVRSSIFSGGTSVHIGWEDGPTSMDVDKLTAKYQYGSFDSSTDMYELNNSNRDIPQVKYVLPSRSMSSVVGEKISSEIGQKFGIDMKNEREVFDKMCMWPDSAIWRVFSESAF